MCFTMEPRWIGTVGCLVVGSGDLLNHVHQPAYIIGNSEMRKGKKTDKPGADKRRGERDTAMIFLS